MTIAAEPEGALSTVPAPVYLRLAATLMEQAADAASPGVWSHTCLGSEGCHVTNDGRLRDRKRVARFGSKDWQADHADAEHVAGMAPAVARAAAAFLRATAANLDDVTDDSVCPCAFDDHAHTAQALADAYLTCTRYTAAVYLLHEWEG